MEIKDEKGVEYLFIRHHHLLGFEKIIEFNASFPDVMALRDGKNVSIELEFSASGLGTHYKIRGSCVYHREDWRKLVHKENKWYIVESGNLGNWWDDEDGNLELVEAKTHSYLRRKSLNYWIDAVVCWKATEFMKSRLEEEGIEVISLEDRLAELGVSW